MKFKKVDQESVLETHLQYCSEILYNSTRMTVYIYALYTKTGIKSQFS